MACELSKNQIVDRPSNTCRLSVKLSVKFNKIIVCATVDYYSSFFVVLHSSRRSTVGGLVHGARVLEAPAQRKVPVLGGDWRGRPPSLLNGKRFEGKHSACFRFIIGYFKSNRI